MSAGKRNGSVDPAQIFVVVGAGMVGPHAETAHGERRAMPGHGHAVVEFLWVLGMDLASVIQCLAHALIRRDGGELHGIRTPDIPAQEHALAAAVKPRVRIANGPDEHITVTDPSLDPSFFPPEAP